MSQLNVQNISGLDTATSSTPAFQVNVQDPLIVKGNLTYSSGSTQRYHPLPYGVTADRPLNPKIGATYFNDSDDLIEVFDGTNWVRSGSGSTSSLTVGTSANPATSGQQLNYLGYSTGYYMIRPNGESTMYRMYVDNRRYGGGWTCCVNIRRESCQSHITTGSFGLYTTNGINYGPVYDAQVTMKMADTFIQNLRNSSRYRGQTPYWLESGHWTNNYGPKNQFFPFAMTINLSNSANEENARTVISLQYEGGQFDDRGPNTGTRGMGDHHTSGGTYFAYGRHPEEGNNCGLREDTLGQANGWFWVK